MEIPFVLKFIEKIELFQVIKKLDKQFEEQIKELEKDSKKVLPLWQIEKKILFWTYKNHKHLGSPLRVDVLKSKKPFLLIGKEIYKMKLTAKEIEKANIRRVFGNLASRDYARFYPEITKKFNRWEKKDDFINREVCENATTTQFNCEGILITQGGILMGELLNDLY